MTAMKDEAGLDERALRQALEQARPYIVDISARVVEYPGKRDEADAALDVLHLIDAALSGQQPADAGCLLREAAAALREHEAHYLAKAERCKEEHHDPALIEWNIAKATRNAAIAERIEAFLTTPPPVPDRQDVEAASRELLAQYYEHPFVNNPSMAAEVRSDGWLVRSSEAERAFRDILKRALQSRPGYEEGVRAAAAVADDMREKYGSPTGDAYSNGLWDQSIRIRGRILALLPTPLTEDQSNEG